MILLLSLTSFLCWGQIPNLLTAGPGGDIDVTVRDHQLNISIPAGIDPGGNISSLPEQLYIYDGVPGRVEGHRKSQVLK